MGEKRSFYSVYKENLVPYDLADSNKEGTHALSNLNKISEVQSTISSINCKNKRFKTCSKANSPKTGKIQDLSSLEFPSRFANIANSSLENTCGIITKSRIFDDVKDFSSDNEDESIFENIKAENFIKRIIDELLNDDKEDIKSLNSNAIHNNSSEPLIPNFELKNLKQLDGLKNLLNIAEKDKENNSHVNNQSIHSQIKCNPVDVLDELLSDYEQKMQNTDTFRNNPGNENLCELSNYSESRQKLPNSNKIRQLRLAASFTNCGTNRSKTDKMTNVRKSEIFNDISSMELSNSFNNMASSSLENYYETVTKSCIFDDVNGNDLKFEVQSTLNNQLIDFDSDNYEDSVFEIIKADGLQLLNEDKKGIKSLCSNGKQEVENSISVICSSSEFTNSQTSNWNQSDVLNELLNNTKIDEGDNLQVNKRRTHDLQSKIKSNSVNRVDVLDELLNGCQRKMQTKGNLKNNRGNEKLCKLPNYNKSSQEFLNFNQISQLRLETLFKDCGNKRSKADQITNLRRTKKFQGSSLMKLPSVFSYSFNSSLKNVCETATTSSVLDDLRLTVKSPKVRFIDFSGDRDEEELVFENFAEATKFTKQRADILQSLNTDEEDSDSLWLNGKDEVKNVSAHQKELCATSALCSSFELTTSKIPNVLQELLNQSDVEESLNNFKKEKQGLSINNESTIQALSDCEGKMQNESMCRTKYSKCTSLHDHQIANCTIEENPAEVDIFNQLLNNCEIISKSDHDDSNILIDLLNDDYDKMSEGSYSISCLNELLNKSEPNSINKWSNINDLLNQENLTSLRVENQQSRIDDNNISSHNAVSEKLLSNSKTNCLNEDGSILCDKDSKHVQASANHLKNATLLSTDVLDEILNNFEANNLSRTNGVLFNKYSENEYLKIKQNEDESTSDISIDITDLNESQADSAVDEDNPEILWSKSSQIESQILNETADGVVSEVMNAFEAKNWSQDNNVLAQQDTDLSFSNHHAESDVRSKISVNTNVSVEVLNTSKTTSSQKSNTSAEDSRSNPWLMNYESANNIETGNLNHSNTTMPEVQRTIQAKHWNEINKNVLNNDNFCSKYYQNETAATSQVPNKTNTLNGRLISFEDDSNASYELPQSDYSNCKNIENELSSNSNTKISNETNILRQLLNETDSNIFCCKITPNARDRCLNKSSTVQEQIREPFSPLNRTQSSILSTSSEGNLTEAERRLRIGINRITKDKLLLRAEPDVDIKLKKECLKRELLKVLYLVAGCEKRTAVFTTRRCSQWDHCIFENNILKLKSGPDVPVTKIKLGSRTSSYNFCLILYLIKRSLSLLATNSMCTHRKIYYEIKNDISNQNQIRRAMNTISSMVNIEPWYFPIVSTSKGLVFGPLTMVMSDGKSLQCNAYGGILIPQDITRIKEYRSRAYFILLIEKDSIFKKLFDENANNKLSRPFIMVTGKGFPDINTRLFVRNLCVSLKIPVFILVDADPHGIDIMLTYRFGSLTLAHLSEKLALPNAKWLGVHPSEMKILNVTRQAMNKNEMKKVDEMLKRPYVNENPWLRRELEVLKSEGFKAEIEGLIKTENYLSNFYLPNKICSQDYF